MSERLSSKWRKRAFKQLVLRDGDFCRVCKGFDETIWRKQGITSTGDWEYEPTCRNQFTLVYPTSTLEVEHIVPLKDGGTNDLSNLQLLCVDCHKAKSARERSAMEPA